MSLRHGITFERKYIANTRAPAVSRHAPRKFKNATGHTPLKKIGRIERFFRFCSHAVGCTMCLRPDLFSQWKRLTHNDWYWERTFCLSSLNGTHPTSVKLCFPFRACCLRCQIWSKSCVTSRPLPRVTCKRNMMPGSRTFGLAVGMSGKVIWSSIVASKFESEVNRYERVRFEREGAALSPQPSPAGG